MGSEIHSRLPSTAVAPLNKDQRAPKFGRGLKRLEAQAIANRAKISCSPNCHWSDREMEPGKTATWMDVAVANSRIPINLLPRLTIQ
jgi:hypothetical protein